MLFPYKKGGNEGIFSVCMLMTVFIPDSVTSEKKIRTLKTSWNGVKESNDENSNSSPI